MEKKLELKSNNMLTLAELLLWETSLLTVYWKVYNFWLRRALEVSCCCTNLSLLAYSKIRNFPP